MAAANTNLVRLSDADRQQLEATLLAFEESWSPDRLAERVPALPPAGHPLRLPTLVELVKIDLERHWQLGCRRTVEEYLRAYPELGTAGTVSPDLLQAEYEVRQQFGGPADLSDFARRFPQRIDRLRRLLQQRSSASQPTPSRPETLPPGARPQPGVGPEVMPEQFGRYRIVRRLGAGGMGTVYQAYDPELKRDVALKVPHRLATDAPDFLERFRREARAAAGLSHPNLCPVYDVGERDGVPYFAMAFIEGRPLCDFLGGKPLPQRKVADVVRKVALALAHLHERGLVHRDLKPSNILVKKDRGEPVVTDFGLARRLHHGEERLTRTGHVAGTLAYLPPEVIGETVPEAGPAGDVYALGVILYELLTGRLPFTAKGIGVAAEILMQEPPPPSSLRPDVDPALEAVCRKAMAKRPEDRYGSMTELAKVLTDYLRDSAPASGLVPVAGATEKAVQSDAAVIRKGRNGRRTWLLASGGVAVVLLAGIATSFKFGQGGGKAVGVVVATPDSHGAAAESVEQMGDKAAVDKPPEQPKETVPAKVAVPAIPSAESGGEDIPGEKASARDADDVAKLKREVELLKKENDLLTREIAILKKENERLKEQVKAGGAKGQSVTKSANPHTLADILTEGKTIGGEYRGTSGGNRVTGQWSLTIQELTGKRFKGTYNGKLTSPTKGEGNSAKVEGVIDGNTLRFDARGANIQATAWGGLKKDVIELQWRGQSAIAVLTADVPK
jgi:predicted Ser/Thr protein kinase